MKKQYKCIVACVNSNGEPDLFFCIVECTEEQYNAGLHYDQAITLCEHEGYEAYLAYDENDSAGQRMTTLFNWTTASVIKS